MAISCILFDHDDTLLPTFALRARVLREAGLLEHADIGVWLRRIVEDAELAAE